MKNLDSLFSIYSKEKDQFISLGWIWGDPFSRYNTRDVVEEKFEKSGNLEDSGDFKIYSLAELCEITNSADERPEQISELVKHIKKEEKDSIKFNF